MLGRCDNRYTTETWYLSGVGDGTSCSIHDLLILNDAFFFLCACVSSRDRLVVRTLRCGRSNPGSNPGHGSDFFFFFFFSFDFSSSFIIIIYFLFPSF